MNKELSMSKIINLLMVLGPFLVFCFLLMILSASIKSFCYLLLGDIDVVKKEWKDIQAKIKMKLHLK